MESDNETRLLEAEAEIDRPTRIDIACGQNKQPDFYGVDIAGDADLIYDLEVYPWPFEDDSADELFCSHYVEHTSDLIKFMNECGRILKAGGKMTIIAPYYSSVRCWQDPTHKHAISENSFLYYNKGWREANRLDHYPITCDFDFTYGYVLDADWANRSVEARDFAIKHYINVVNDIHVTLTKRDT